MVGTKGTVSQDPERPTKTLVIRGRQGGMRAQYVQKMTKRVWLPVLTLRQPWAIAMTPRDRRGYGRFDSCGAKRVETRSWEAPPELIGRRVAIHSSKRWTGQLRDTWNDLTDWITDNYKPFEWPRLVGRSVNGTKQEAQLGCVLAVGTLSHCLRMDADLVARTKAERPLEFKLGVWEVGRWAWIFRDVQRVEPAIPAKGKQGIWFLNGSPITELLRQGIRVERSSNDWRRSAGPVSSPREPDESKAETSSATPAGEGRIASQTTAGASLNEAGGLDEASKRANDTELSAPLPSNTDALMALLDDDSRDEDW